MSPGRLVLGLVLVAIGVVAVLDGADVLTGTEVVGDWWPVALVALGTTQAVADRRLGWGSGAVLVLGLVLLGGTTGLFGGDGLSLVGPVLLIVLGLAVIAGWSLRRSVLTEDRINRFAVASSPRLVVRSEALERANLTVVAGSAKMDLTRARLDPAGATVSVVAVAGSATVVVPEGWRVVVRGFAVVGGWDDTTSRVVPDDAPELTVRILTVVGGVDVRHRRRWV